VSERGTERERGREGACRLSELPCVCARVYVRERERAGVCVARVGGRVCDIYMCTYVYSVYVYL